MGDTCSGMQVRMSPIHVLASRHWLKGFGFDFRKHISWLDLYIGNVMSSLGRSAKCRSRYRYQCYEQKRKHGPRSWLYSNWIDIRR